MEYSKRIILRNNYKSREIWFRYYFLKLLPKFLYPNAVRYFYEKKLNRKINIENPVTLTDKLNYLKLFDVTQAKTLLTNKLTAKAVIKKNFPELNYAKVFQVCSSFDEIDFSKCPKSFIIKTNHACKTGTLVEDKTKLTKKDIKNYRKYYNTVLNINYAYWGILELQYKDIVPVLYIEEFLASKNSSYNIREYNVFCINGEPEFIQYICSYDNNKEIIFFLDTEFKTIDLSLFERLPYNKVGYSFELPNKDKILKYSKLLSSEFKFVRVDFFEVNDVLYFGEMTFTPHCCVLKFVPEDIDFKLGQKLKI